MEFNETETKEKEEDKMMVDIDYIKNALIDPKAPWYGSDLVSAVADLVREYQKKVERVCKNCRWWDKELLKPSYDGEIIGIQRYCLYLNSVDGMDCVTVIHGDAEIITSPNFRCVFWEKRERVMPPAVTNENKGVSWKDSD